MAALSRKGLRGAVGSASRTTTPNRSSPRFSAASPAAIRWSRCRSSARVRRSSPRRFPPARSNSRWSPIIRACRGFELLVEQPLVWAASERFRVEDGAPIPLALGATTCLWRREADEALAAASRPARGLFFSKNYSAIGTVVRAGLAVTTLPASMVGEGLRILGPDQGLPELPLTRMGLIHAPGRPTEEAKALADAIRMTVEAPARRAA